MSQSPSFRSVLPGLERVIRSIDDELESVHPSERKPVTKLEREQEELRSETRLELVEVRRLILEAKSRIQSIPEGIDPVGI